MVATMPEMTPERLAEIETRCNATTPGPWEYENIDDGMCMNADVVRTCGDGAVDDFPLDGPYEDKERIVAITLLQAPRFASIADNRWEENAQFIAHARTDVPDLIAEIRRLTTERDAAVAQAQASGQAETTPRVALDRAIHFMGNAGCRISEEIGEDGWAAYCAPPTAHAKLAAARAAYIAADRALQAAQSRTESIAVLNALDARKKRADYALAVAEEEAGVDGDA